ncbi:DUF4123 domain-containing protein [uncultured Litoreibacter sp.]|uniref:DUF4123 domain-containing protein n=1 Tax=uncultured Litoreibacter sp. TaxID=1392394 RepID=UPI00260730C7|nr:DUF4123 domain-containing protein [uncultured Litoreibacter sp.]
MFLEPQIVPVTPLTTQPSGGTDPVVPDACADLIFPDGPMTTYAIVDAALLPAFDGADDAGGLRASCLFNAAAAETLGDCGPYLVQLEPGHSFVGALFTAGQEPWVHWDRSAYILVQSRASFDAVRAHFRRFTKISDRDGAWFFLRFYMPEAMDEIMAGLAQSPAHLARWYQISGADPIERYIVPRPDAGTLHIHGWDSAQHAQLTAVTPAPYLLDEQYEAILRRIRDLRLVRRLTSAILHDYENLHELDADQTRALIHAGLRGARAEGLRTELAMGQFAAAGFLMGTPMTRAHLERVPGYCDRSAHENRRTRALLDHAEAAAARRLQSTQGAA